jgi:transcriptional regulator with XRE-family HTH domain
MPTKRKSTPRSPDHAVLGQAIEVLIAKDARMTQETVAADGGLNIKQVGTYARGQGNPTYANLLKLCRGLHVSPVQLLALVDELERERMRR